MRTRRRQRRQMVHRLVIVGAGCACMAVLAAAVAAYNSIGSGPAPTRATKAMLGTIQNAIKEFQLVNNSLPGCLEALQEGGQSAFLDKDKKIVDAWGRPFVYRAEPLEGHQYLLCSKGPDGKLFSADDVSVWALGAK